jgi:hypothetical protein
MMTFKEFLIEQDCLEERLARKGAVATYAAQGKRHGDKAIQHYRDAKKAFVGYSTKETTDEKLDALIKAIIAMTDGFIATRNQIGSVSAQITASSLL